MKKYDYAVEIESNLDVRLSDEPKLFYVFFICGVEPELKKVFRYEKSAEKYKDELIKQSLAIGLNINPL